MEVWLLLVAETDPTAPLMQTGKERKDGRVRDRGIEIRRAKWGQERGRKREIRKEKTGIKGVSLLPPTGCHTTQRGETGLQGVPPVRPGHSLEAEVAQAIKVLTDQTETRREAEMVSAPAERETAPDLQEVQSPESQEQAALHKSWRRTGAGKRAGWRREDGRRKGCIESEEKEQNIEDGGRGRGCHRRGRVAEAKVHHRTMRATSEWEKMLNKLQNEKTQDRKEVKKQKNQRGTTLLSYVLWSAWKKGEFTWIVLFLFSIFVSHDAFCIITHHICIILWKWTKLEGKAL